MVQIPKLLATDPRTLVIERLDQPGERVEFAIGDDSTGFYDLAKAKAKPLARGGVYRATIGVNKVTFKIDAKAKIVGKTDRQDPRRQPAVALPAGLIPSSRAWIRCAPHSPPY